jgi:fluoroacetyl-CoA thioesterase
MTLMPGLRGRVRAVVSAQDTAEAMGSGDVPVLGTPRLLALAEAASMAAVAQHLAEGQTTVGTAVSLEHRKACPLGTGLTVEAELTEADGRRLVFGFIARLAAGEGPGRHGPGECGEAANDESDVVGAGTVERVVLDRERFLARWGVAAAEADPVDPGQGPGQGQGAVGEVLARPRRGARPGR